MKGDLLYLIHVELEITSECLDKLISFVERREDYLMDDINQEQLFGTRRNTGNLVEEHISYRFRVVFILVYGEVARSISIICDYFLSTTPFCRFP